MKPDDVLTLIYTSGTTGPPKGVQLTHDNLVGAVKAFDEVIPFPDDGRVISWLPYAHIAERACSHYLPLMLGFTTTDCPDPRQVVAYLPEVRPSWFFAVPRIWEKLKAAIEAGIEAEQDAERKKEAVENALEGRPEEGRARAGRGGDPRGAGRAVRAGRRAGVLQDARAPRLRPGRVGERGRRAHAARGDQVLPRDRHPARGAVGHVGDLRLGHREPAGQDQDRHGRPAVARRGGQAGRRRRGDGARAA